MSVKILSGIEPAAHVLKSVEADVKLLDPKLVIVQVGSDSASDAYVGRKLNACEKIGMRHDHIRFRENVTQAEMFAQIKALNDDPDVTGYIIQLPLPSQLEKVQPQLFREIDRYKDVDGFTAYNLGKMFIATEFEHLPPATPAGIIELLHFYDIEIQGKNVVLVGHSNIVGKPLAIMMLNRGATVTICHEGTKDLPSFTRNADILVTAVGKPGLITVDMVKEGSVVIDIGITPTGRGLKGDADYDALKNVVSAITPVPGGVGPMTVACLLQNVITAKKRQMERDAK